MATDAGVSIDTSSYALTGGPPGSRTIAGAIDRWIYVFMAGLFVVTALAGFIPDSLAKVAAVQAGQRPPFPIALHAHAVLMGAWLLLLLAQTSLMATGRSGWHRRLGVASMVLAPAIVLVGFILVPTMYRSTWTMVQAAPPEMAAGMQQILGFVNNILLVQLRIGILFPLFVALALAARRKDPGTHKRFIILATVLPLPAAIDRMFWLPHTMPDSPLSIDLYMLLWISPMFLWDLFRLGRVHRTYLVWFAANLPFVVVLHLLWGSAWWAETAPRLMGVSG